MSGRVHRSRKYRKRKGRMLRHLENIAKPIWRESVEHGYPGGEIDFFRGKQGALVMRIRTPDFPEGVPDPFPFPQYR